MPDLSEEHNKFVRTAKEFDISLDELKNAARSAKLEHLDDNTWSRLENTDSYETDTLEKVAVVAGQFDRDFKRIVKGLKGQLPASIVLFQDGAEPYLVAGNTRLMVARASGIRPSILAIRL